MAYYSNRNNKNDQGNYKNYNKQPDRYKNQVYYSKHDRHSPRPRSNSKDKFGSKERTDRNNKKDTNKAQKDSRRDYRGQNKDYYVSSYKSTHYDGQYRDRSRSRKDRRSPSDKRDRRRSPHDKRNSRDRSFSKASDRSRSSRSRSGRKYRKRSPSLSKEHDKGYDAKSKPSFNYKRRYENDPGTRIIEVEKGVEERNNFRRDSYKEQKSAQKNPHWNEKREERRDDRRQDKRDTNNNYGDYYRSENRHKYDQKIPSREPYKYKTEYLSAPSSKFSNQYKSDATQRKYKKEEYPSKQLFVQKPQLQSSVSEPPVFVSVPPPPVSAPSTFQHSNPSLQKTVSLQPPNNILKSMPMPPPPPPQQIPFASGRASYKQPPKNIQAGFGPFPNSNQNGFRRGPDLSGDLFVNKNHQQNPSSKSYVPQPYQTSQSSKSQQILPTMQKAFNLPIQYPPSISSLPHTIRQQSLSQVDILVSKAQKLTVRPYPSTNFIILQCFKRLQTTQFQQDFIDAEWMQKINQQKNNTNLHRSELVDMIKTRPENFQTTNPSGRHVKVFRCPNEFTQYGIKDLEAKLIQLNQYGQSLCALDNTLALAEAQLDRAIHNRQNIENNMKIVQE